MYISKCCNSSVRAVGDTTKHYLCEACSQSCDVFKPSEVWKHNTDGEECWCNPEVIKVEGERFCEGDGLYGKDNNKNLWEYCVNCGNKFLMGTKNKCKNWKECEVKQGTTSTGFECILDLMVRDFTKIIPRSKSEVRRRIKELVTAVLEEIDLEKDVDELYAIKRNLKKVFK